VKPVAALVVALCLHPAPSRADYAAGAALYAQRDYQRAFYEMVRAANDGSADAQFTLGVMYDVGQHVRVDKATAAAWYRQAALQGEPNAQLRLARMMFDGEGIKRDRRAGYVWALLAAERLPGAKRKDAVDEAARMRSSLSEGEARRARSDAAGWQPRLAALPPRSEGEMRRAAVGTGVFVNRDGTMLTNLHVASPCRQVLVSDGEELHDAKVATFDVALDLAVLKTPFRPEASAIFAAAPLAVGERIGLTGYAPRQARRMPLSTAGAVTALADMTGNDDFFLTSAEVFAGQSGGAVTREGGALVGLIKGSGRRESFSLAIASRRIAAFLSRAKVPFRQAAAGPDPAATIAFVECWR
jgi:S1-C subfamily serine protease